MAALVVLSIALIIADHRGWLLVRGSDDLVDYHGALVRIVRVIDGVAFEIDRPDRVHGTPRTRVRLWGVARPGAGADRKAAVAVARAWLRGDRVILWLEPGRTRGTFGYLLAHVERSDGSTLNETLLEAGAAIVDDRWPHGRLSAYARAESRARLAGRGCWAS